MKTYLLVIFLLISLQSLPAQIPGTGDKDGVKTAELKVNGVCGMCEKRIENAALIKGVKLAEWDKETQILKVVYKPDKVTIEKIHEAVAESGHTTDKTEANQEKYSELPKCCQYDHGAHKH